MSTTPVTGIAEPTPRSTQLAGPQAAPTRTVTILVGTVVALTFLFGFGNVLTLGLHLGVPLWVAPLIAPAVDLSVVGLLLATRHLALHHGPELVIRSARRLLLFASLVTLALNVAEPLIDRRYGLAAFDTVGPLLLIGWAHVGPGLLHAMNTTPEPPAACPPSSSPALDAPMSDDCGPAIRRAAHARATGLLETQTAKAAPAPADPARDDARRQDLLHRARAEDALHWQHHHRPISAETLRRHLHISTRTARTLVGQLRADTHARLPTMAPSPRQNGKPAPAVR